MQGLREGLCLPARAGLAQSMAWVQASKCVMRPFVCMPYCHGVLLRDEGVGNASPVW